jgi:hypothetical protein
MGRAHTPIKKERSMKVQECKWRVSLYLSDVLDIAYATVEVKDELGRREIVRMITGPFDSPDDVLERILELIDAADWHGKQLAFPIPPQPEVVQP